MLENVDLFRAAEFDYLKSLDELTLVDFFCQCHLLYRPLICGDCGEPLGAVCMEGSSPYVRCSKRRCRRRKVFLFKGTFLGQKKITLKDFIKLLENFACMRTQGDSIQTIELSAPTVQKYYEFFRKIIFEFMDCYSTPFDSDTVNLHLDETPITHRHGHQGTMSRSNTVWVIGVVDIFNRKCVLKFLPSRGHRDIVPFVDNWIARGVEITTDGLASYRILGRMGFLHNTVNHSRHLVAPDGTNTNRIEGIFGATKRLMRDYKFRYTNVRRLDFFLAEWCFRYCHENFQRMKCFTSMLFLLRWYRANHEDSDDGEYDPEQEDEEE